MGSVTALPHGRSLTVDDLDALPDDGHRYELIDGALVVTPSPSRRHQLVSSRLHAVLDRACPDHQLVLAAPSDVRLADDTVLQPDLLVVDRAGFDDPEQPLRPLLVVEILSPSTRHIDLSLKRVRYEAAGCPSYWVIDPDLLTLRVWQVEEGQYAETGSCSGSETCRVSHPFLVDVTPAQLIR